MTDFEESNSSVEAVRGRRILIVEDEFLLASDLARYFSSLGAEILGPVPSRDQAWQYLPMAEVALLDLNLNGQMVFPVADQLASLRIPFVFYSGYDIAIPERFNSAWMLKKPVTSQQLATIIGSELSGRRGAAGKAPREAEADNIFDILAKLRENAHFMLSDGAAGDQLVENALRMAILEAPSRPQDMPLLLWLTEILERAHNQNGHHRIH
ncbi:response regulator [Hoeflea marina]|uniref:response regulator n=1 Tax=Hoeflea marina TaxID=274592 RepID=UPI0011B67F82|nr:response regulator [Hoeflea marina]